MPKLLPTTPTAASTSTPNPATPASDHKHEATLRKKGRALVEIVDTTATGARFARAKRDLEAKCDCHVKVRTLYHSTSEEAGRAIIRSGFKIPTKRERKAGGGTHGTAFGRGVNFCKDFGETLFFAGPGRGATLVCKVAIGRMHHNVSRPNPDPANSGNSVPDFQVPRRGYDAMHGMLGDVIVVPCVARIRPMRLFVHEPTRPTKPSKSTKVKKGTS